jgi:hypothetical protein
MPFSTNFDNHVKRALQARIKKLTWKTNWNLKGFRWRVDLAGLDGDRPCILIEAELKKDDPAANVIKIWSWAREQRNSHPILFVQGFSKLYWTSKTTLRERASFVGERMAEDGLKIKYRAVRIGYVNKNGQWVHYNPRVAPGFHAKQGAGRLRLAAQGLAKEVARLERKVGLSRRKHPK